MKHAMKLIVALTFLLGVTDAYAQTYCEPPPFGFQFCSTTWSIDDITIGSYSEQNSGCNTFGYWSYNASANISLTKGSAVSFSLASGGDLVQWSIWVDCNSDGDFTDAGDYHWASTSPSSSVSGNIIIPASATGTSSRMRIMSSIQSLPIQKADACLFPFNNETQDFSVILNSPGACSVPVNLTAVPGVTDAFLSWDSVGTQYNVEYGLQGFAPGSGTTLNPTTDTITITGLTASTTYDFYVQNDCSASSGDSSTWNGPISFITECLEISSFPAVEGFENSPWVPNTGFQQIDDTISNCWDRNPEGGFGYEWKMRDGSTPSSQTGPNAGYGGSGTYAHIEANGSLGDEATFTSPLYNITSLTSPYLSFYYHMYGSEMGNLYIDVSSNGGVTWVAIDSIIGEQQTSDMASWLERGINVNAYSSATFQYRFRSEKTQNGWRGDMAIDEVSIAEAPQCPKPSGFMISNITSSAVDLSWLSSDPTFYVEYGVAGFTQGTGAIDTVNGTSHNLSNLASDTWWDVYIQTDCSVAGNGQSGWAGPYSFRTLLAPVWLENFDVDGFIPNNRWSKAEGVIGNPTSFTSTFSGWTEDGWLNNGFSGSVKSYISSFSPEKDWFFTEQIDLGTGNSWELHFDAAVTLTGSSLAGSLEADDTLKVVISTDGGNTWYNSNTVLTVSQANNLSNAGQTFVADLTNYSGVIKVGFYMESSIANTNALDLFVDNLGIRVPVTCPAPSGLNATSISANALTLAWTSNINPKDFIVEYGPKGFAQGTGTLLTGITADSVVVTGLQPVTEYDFYISSICGSDTSTWSMTTILTGCPAVFNTPYFTDFDVLSAGNPPPSGAWDNCWVSNNSTGFKYRWQTGDGASQWANTGPDVDHTTGVAGEGVYMYTEASNSGVEATLINGPFDLSQLVEPTLTFWYHMFGAQMGDLHVDVSTDAQTWQEEVFTLSGQQQTSGADNWMQAKIALSQYATDSIYIRFRAIKGSGSQGDMAIDDVAFEEASGCIAPSGLNAINKTTSSVDLVWGSYASTHTLEWGPAGFVQGSGQSTVVTGITGSSYQLTGLATATAYDFYVQDTCNANNWVGPKRFYTGCNSAYNGTYTVGGTSSDFNNLQSALEGLSNCGMSGPVILNLQGINDTLAYTLEAFQIPGQNAANTLTIQGNGNDNIYSYPTADYLLAFKGASYITIKNVSFFNRFGNMIIWLYDGAHHINVEDCEFYAYNGTTTNFSSASIAATALPTSATSAGQNANDISIKNNTFYNGYTGISFYGESANHSTGLTIENNEFVLPSNYGVRVNYVDTVFITDNTMQGHKPGTTFGYGISLNRCENFTIQGNWLVSNGPALSISNANNNIQSAHSLVANNMLVALTNSDGLYLNSSNYVDVFHNSTSSVGNGARIQGFSGNGRDIDVRNNIFSSLNDEALYVNTTDSNLTFDYNIYHNASGDLVYYNGSGYATLSAWQTANNSLNANSIENDPGYFSSTDLHIISTVPNDVGDNTVGITTDIDGESRPASGSTTVDIGADEFTPKNNDIALESIYEPFIGCGDSTTIVKVVIRNMGINTVTSVPLTVVISGDISATLSATYTGNLTQLAFDTVTVGTFNSYAGAQSVSFSAYSSLTNDEDSSNDTIVTGPYFFIPAEPSAEGLDTICFDPTATGSMVAEAYNGVYYGWYANQNDTTPVAVGDTFTYPLSGQTDWYLGYLDALTDSLQVNGYNALFGGSGGVMFDLTAKTNLVIDSLDLHARTNAGTVGDLIIYYIPNASYVNNTNNASDWIVLDTIQYTGAGNLTSSKAVLPTPLQIPSNATYAIYLQYDAYWESANSINQVVNTPFMRYEGGVGFFSGAFSGLSSNRTFDGVIYAHNVVCATSKTLISQPFYADTAIASFNTVVSQPNKVDVDASASQGDLIEWNFGDGTTANGAITSHTYTNGGQYTILCTVTDTVCNTVDTVTFSVQMTIGIDENALANAVQIYPNPSNGAFNLNFTAEADEATLTVVNALGKVIQINTLDHVSVGENYMIDLTEEPSGLYFIRIEIDEAVAVKKVTKL